MAVTNGQLCSRVVRVLFAPVGSGKGTSEAGTLSLGVSSHTSDAEVVLIA